MSRKQKPPFAPVLVKTWLDNIKLEGKGDDENLVAANALRNIKQVFGSVKTAREYLAAVNRL